MRLTKPSDGPVSALINRRVSLMISAPLAKAGVSPNGATLVSGLIGAGSAVSYVFQVRWLGCLLLQLSSIFGGVDGEIARRTGQTSRYGDFLDTTVDRAVEYGAIAAIAVGLSDVWGVWAWGVALATLGGTFVLTSTSEKYRSVMGRNYPKREIDGALAFIASGRDVRLFVIAVVSVLATIDADILFWALVTLAAAIHLTFLYRVVALKSVMNRAD